MNALEDKAVSRALAKKADVPTPPGSEGVVETEQDALDGGQTHRLPGHDQGRRGRRRARHARGAQRHFAGQGLSHRARARRRRPLATPGSISRSSSRTRTTSSSRSWATTRATSSTWASAIARSSAATRRWSKKAPSPLLDNPKFKKLREKMGKAAIKIAEAANYTNAGTVEFIVDTAGPLLLPRSEQAHPGRASDHRGGDRH